MRLIHCISASFHLFIWLRPDDGMAHPENPPYFRTMFTICRFSPTTLFYKGFDRNDLGAFGFNGCL